MLGMSLRARCDTTLVDIISNVRKMKWTVLGTSTASNCQRRPMDLACHHLETIRQEKATRETSHAMEGRHGQILEGHDLAEDKTG